MFSLLSQYSQGRLAWLLLCLGSLAFEGTALYFQHFLDLAPCSLCIYQRVAILGIAIASIIGIINPKISICRYVAIFLWLFCAGKGFSLSFLQARLQFAPDITDTCSISVDFPSFLPLQSWFPSIFKAYGFCADKVWSFLTIEMSQWMIIIFSCYFIVGTLILVSQFFTPKTMPLETNKSDFFRLFIKKAHILRNSFVKIAHNLVNKWR